MFIIHPQTPRRTAARGLTFMELLIALSVTALVCGILAVLINATAVGTNTTNDGRRSLVRLESIKAVLQDEFINARAILATGNNYVVYWAGDQPGAATPANNAVNYTEMRLLEVDPNTGNLNLYQIKWDQNYDSSWIIAYDTTCATSTDWYAACTSLKSTPYYPVATIATGVTGMTISLDSATATSAKLINFNITLNDGTVSRQLILAVGLANPMAPY